MHRVAVLEYHDRSFRNPSVGSSPIMHMQHHPFRLRQTDPFVSPEISIVVAVDADPDASIVLRICRPVSFLELCRPGEVSALFRQSPGWLARPETSGIAMPSRRRSDILDPFQPELLGFLVDCVSRSAEDVDKIPGRSLCVELTQMRLFCLLPENTGRGGLSF